MFLTGQYRDALMRDFGVMSNARCENIGLGFPSTSPKIDTIRPPSRRYGVPVNPPILLVFESIAEAT
jgi:hypothetical protein